MCRSLQHIQRTWAWNQCLLGAHPLCDLEMVYLLKAKPFWLSPAFLAVLFLTCHPWGQYLFFTNTEANQDQILFFSSHTLYNILAFTGVKFHTSLSHENRMPLWTPGPEEVTVIVMNLCDRYVSVGHKSWFSEAVLFLSRFERQARISIVQPQLVTYLWEKLWSSFEMVI